MRLSAASFAEHGLVELHPDTTGSQVVPPTGSAAGRPARLISAFFGLDNALPRDATALCLGAAGLDGMPVIFSHTIDDLPDIHHPSHPSQMGRRDPG